MNRFDNIIQLVISRYNENLNWTLEEPFNKFQYIVYNKGDNDLFEKSRVKEIINVPNVGRESETYLQHVIKNYHHLPNILVFFPGSLDLPAKNVQAKKILNKIIQSNFTHAYFVGHVQPSVRNSFKSFKLDNWACTNVDNLKQNSSSQLKPCLIRPYARWYDYHFGEMIANWSTWFGVFSVSKLDILQHSIRRYQRLISTVNHHSNPEAGHYMERSWGVVFGPFKNTQTIY